MSWETREPLALEEAQLLVDRVTEMKKQKCCTTLQACIKVGVRMSRYDYARNKLKAAAKFNSEKLAGYVEKNREEMRKPLDPATVSEPDDLPELPPEEESQGHPVGPDYSITINHPAVDSYVKVTFEGTAESIAELLRRLQG